ncbi:hypothetical protein [Rhodococcus sp. NPDC060176]|uniref:hypothetical protein n=1 Tax=Rhodococcus sp. NPDC060176 TaxID=3347062 RepID=UPI00366A06BD
MFDRLSLRTVATDYWRSLRRYGTSERDTSATLVIFGVPVALFVVALLCGFRMWQPTALLPAVALLAGVLLAAAGQILTLRARIADSLVLSSNKRVTGHIRETMSGVVLAAVAALADALLLGGLASAGDADNWITGILSALVLMCTAYLALMFLVTARRLYSTYLEVFEGGAGLPRRSQREIDEQHEYEAGSLDVS